ncbi:hypothetical protein [Lactobacillus sp. B4026]|uniref:hypothetical protein n=1 Tax=Lactobacillus sp. B4026 TaxID=2818035 RepID=UPI00226B3DF2|nr:hypothetical protein [Lactobacillus sp. B4026]MCX8737316.1 hypothetical protein [Lactobacillus sp. B4026]
MNYENEVEKYKEFCEKYFSKFKGKTFLENKKAIIKTFQIISLFFIIKDYDISDNKNLPLLSKMSIDTLFDILISIPIGDSLFFSACSRQFAEELLELVYTEYCNKKISEKDLLALNYRKLWQDGIQKSIKYKLLSPKDTKGILREKSKLDSINFIFKSNSDKLHFKDQNISTTQYLEQIINGKKYNSKIIIRNINKFHLFCIDLLPIILKLDIDKMSIVQRKDYLDLINSLALYRTFK